MIARVGPRSGLLPAGFFKMRGRGRVYRRVVVGAVLSLGLAYAQDSPPSLGDAARQARFEKQQKETQTQSAQSKTATDNSATNKDGKGNETQPSKPKKVITNDEIPEHVGPTSTRPPTPKNQYPACCTGNDYPSPGMNAADVWKSQIQNTKNSIAAMEQQLAGLDQSIQFSQAPCVTTNCVEYNERQRQKQAQSELLKSQIEQMRQRLEQMQEAARKQGFGSSVYDP
jgi:hypothetical protein